ncbi:VOC family protein [Sphingomonas elodea]|uniref:VOC family protein n=1 Tax=Sphingomonas elodea TaxID=179878 RepID=UPI0002630B0B|nr:VOC family protein [Sphingomonas elodea]
MILADPPLHHVGIVQPDEDAVQAMMATLGLTEDYRGYVPQFQATCIFTRAAGRSPIEFVVPDGGPLERFNKGAGGIHHLAFEVPDLAAVEAHFAALGSPMLEERSVQGAGNFLCNFLRPSATRGVIVEYIQIL